VRRNKTDRTDAAALLEARRRGEMLPVPVTTSEPQLRQALHHGRRHWQRTRTARITALRGVRREPGLPIAVGARPAMTRMPVLLEDATTPRPDLVRPVLWLMLKEVRALETRLATLDRQLTPIARTHPIARRLPQVPGVGVLIATALVGTGSHIHAFRRGRQVASWLGLTPRESSTGSRRRWGGIRKRGDVYVRCRLTHGARAVVLTAPRTARVTPHRLTRCQQGAVAVAARRGPHTAAIAVATTLARIIWVVWPREIDGDDTPCETIAA
jgi:transposase